MSVLQKYYTTTTKFILPILFNDNITYKDVLTKVFNDSYIADMKRPEYDDKILLVFYLELFKDDEIYNEKVNKLILKNIEAKQITSYIDGDYFVYVYDIPEQFIEDYFKVIDSKYNETSKDYYNKLMIFWEYDKKLSDVLSAYTWEFKKHMYKKPPIKYRAFDLELEIFNLGLPL